ncbi:HipA family kinase [Pseudoxanthomonas broegbernensis]|uniref:HipA family kinase n=1 Tax=Pseudoxanthomonas broegbernensis TaxID=83619 RepID=UPI003CCDDACB
MSDPLPIVEILERSEQGRTRPFLCRCGDDRLYFLMGGVPANAVSCANGWPGIWRGRSGYPCSTTSGGSVGLPRRLGARQCGRSARCGPSGCSGGGCRRSGRAGA